uniref:Uncharacterized protein n=1 Tax=Arundo donax TaxID=35708 RepID=A0A0A9BUW7_ARUDO
MNLFKEIHITQSPCFKARLGARHHPSPKTN